MAHHEETSFELYENMDTVPSETGEREEILTLARMAPILTRKPKESFAALITRPLVKVASVVIVVVAILGFIRATKYPRTRTEWEFVNPEITLTEGAQVTYVQITSTVPCHPQNATDRWAAFKDYEDSSLGVQEGSRADMPDCSLLDENPDCWIIAPEGGCDAHIEWKDLYDLRNEAIQAAYSAEIQRVYPSDPMGQITTSLRLATGPRKEYSCLTVTARARYVGVEEFGPWELISNCSKTMVNGSDAIEVKTKKKELDSGDKDGSRRVTLLTKWPPSSDRELQSFFEYVPSMSNTSVPPRVRRSVPVYEAPSVTEQAGGCPHRVQEPWFKWAVAVVRPGTKIDSYPAGLPWLKNQTLAGKRILYFMDMPVLSTDQVEKITGKWGTQVLESLLDCIASKLDPLDEPWRDLPAREFFKRWVTNSGEMVPICREARRMGIPTRDDMSDFNGTLHEKGTCKVDFRALLRRFRVAVNVPPSLGKEAEKWKARHVNSWRNYAGLGLTHYEVELLNSCWAKPGSREDEKLRLFIHQQLAAQILGFQLYNGLIFKTTPHTHPAAFMVTLGKANKDPPKEDIPDPNLNPDGTQKPMEEWVLDWKKKYPGGRGFQELDPEGRAKGLYHLPPPLVLTKKTPTGYILRWGMEPTYQATGAQVGAYPETTYGIRGKQYCTPEDQSQCTSTDLYPETHVDEATSAMVDLASTRTVTHVPMGPGRNVTWVNWGSLTHEQASEIGCDAQKMVSRYYVTRNPPPQRHAWANIFWYDAPVIKSKADRNRWIAVTGQPGFWYLKTGNLEDVGAPVPLRDCYRASSESSLGEKQDSITVSLRVDPESRDSPMREVTYPCGKLQSNSLNRMEKGFPYFWPPEVYLLSRWSFANSPYCNNNGLGNCRCLKTCGDAGWTGQLLGPCHSEHFDFGTPWQLPSDYLVNGGPLSPEVGWTARNFTLMAVFPHSHAADMNNGSCVPSRVDDTPVAKKKWSEWRKITFVTSRVATVVGQAGIDLSESIKDGAIEVYDTVTSVVQTTWRIIAGAIKWAVPCMILVGVVFAASVLYQLGLCKVIGQPLKDTWGWAWGRSGTSQGAEPLLSGSY